MIDKILDTQPPNRLFHKTQIIKSYLIKTKDYRKLRIDYKTTSSTSPVITVEDNTIRVNFVPEAEWGSVNVFTLNKASPNRNLKNVTYKLLTLEEHNRLEVYVPLHNFN